MVKWPLAILQFGQTNVIHQEVRCAVTDNIDEQIILHPEVVNKLSGINREKALLESQELASTEVNNDNLSEKKDMRGNNYDVYAIRWKIDERSIKFTKYWLKKNGGREK